MQGVPRANVFQKQKTSTVRGKHNLTEDVGVNHHHAFMSPQHHHHDYKLPTITTSHMVQDTASNAMNETH